MGQVRVLSTHFEKIKGQKDKLKGHQYSFLAAQRVLIRVIQCSFVAYNLWIDIEKFAALRAECIQIATF